MEQHVRHNWTCLASITSSQNQNGERHARLSASELACLMSMTGQTGKQLSQRQPNLSIGPSSSSWRSTTYLTTSLRNSCMCVFQYSVINESAQSTLIRPRACSGNSMQHLGLQFPYSAYTRGVGTDLSFDEFVSDLRAEATQRTPAGSTPQERKWTGVYSKRKPTGGRVYAFEARYTKRKSLKVQFSSAYSCSGINVGQVTTAPLL
jgi:hypothetical protein